MKIQVTLLLITTASIAKSGSPPETQVSDSPCLYCMQAMMGEKEPIEEDRLRTWCESSLSKTYEKREMKTFVNHICASTEEDTSLLHHVNVLRSSGSVKPASICGLLGAPDLPCMCPEGGSFLLERDVKLAINAIKTFAASVPSNLQRFAQLGKGLLTKNKLRIRSQAKLAVTGCTSTNPRTQVVCPANADIHPEGLLYKARRHKDLEKVQEKFCKLLMDRKFSGFVVDVDLARTEMVISEASKVVTDAHVKKCRTFQKCDPECIRYQDPLFTTRQWMRTDKSIAVGFNANFYDMSENDVRTPGSCHESFGLVLDKSKIWNPPERSEVRKFEEDTHVPYPEGWLSEDVDGFCEANKYRCNVKGSAALIVDNFRGLAYVASYPTTRMIEELPCMENGACNGFAGNFLYWNGRPIDKSQLNPDSRKRARTVVGVKDGGRRIVVLIAERERPDGTLSAFTHLATEHDTTRSLAMTGSEGATLDEMQELCKFLGLADCLNLDGGGSSSMVYQETRMGKVLRSNIPEDLIVDKADFEVIYDDRPAAHHFGFRYRPEPPKESALRPPSPPASNSMNPLQEDAVSGAVLPTDDVVTVSERSLV
eukprot:g2771.t1